MNHRSERILAELSYRYDLKNSFVERLRPWVDRIVDEEIPEHQQIALLELLAETCERQKRIDESTLEAQRALKGFVSAMKELFDRVQRFKAITRASKLTGPPGC